MAEIRTRKTVFERCTGAISEVMSTSLGLLESANNPTETFSISAGNLEISANPVEMFTITN